MNKNWQEQASEDNIILQPAISAAAFFYLTGAGRIKSKGRLSRRQNWIVARAGAGRDYKANYRRGANGSEN